MRIKIACIFRVSFLSLLRFKSCDKNSQILLNGPIIFELWNACAVSRFRLPNGRYRGSGMRIIMRWDRCRSAGIMIAVRVAWVRCGGGVSGRRLWRKEQGFHRNEGGWCPPPKKPGEGGSGVPPPHHHKTLGCPGEQSLEARIRWGEGGGGRWKEVQKCVPWDGGI